VTTLPNFNETRSVVSEMVYPLHIRQKHQLHGL